nr:MAG TPA: hypothetical protein [Caudoviricetes sp.]
MADPQPPFATVDDVESRWKPLSDAEKKRVEILLVDAADVIMTTCPKWKKAAEGTLRRIVCAVVRRAMPTAFEAGVKQMQETTGPFSNTFTAANPDGDLYLTKRERLALGCGRPTAFEADLTKNRG